MYSDDSDDDEVRQRLGSHPYLLLFGTEVRDSIAWGQYSCELGTEIGAGDPATVTREKRDSAFYRALRFFRSMEGFHKGSLDLTGRHESRYLKLQARWSAYIADFFALSVHAEEFMNKDRRGVPYIDYRFNDPNVWMEFGKKWRVFQASWDYGSLLGNTEIVLQVIADHPLPQLQNLCLTNLPSEMIDKVFEHASLERARLLSATCRWLNDIGRRYIFRRRTLGLKFPPNPWKEIRDATDPVDFLSQLAQSMKAKALSSTTFLLTRPDLMKEMRTVSIIDGWKPATLDLFVDGGFDISNTDGFYAPLYDSFTTILSGSGNLTSVKFFSLTLTADFIRCITQLSRLHTLVLSQCHIPPYVQGMLEDDGGIALSCSALNLHLSISKETFSLWHAMLLCPRLRSLSAHSVTEDLTPPPPPVCIKCLFFPTLERLSLSPINPNAVRIYYLWFRSRPAATKLTHLKFYARFGMSDIHARALLRALRAPSLRVLVLEGLAQAEFRLFDLIARRFRKLTGLTLIRRANNRQIWTKQFIWPHPSWEYARHLNGLQHLQHFAWNYDDAYNRFSSAPLLRFERGFCDELDWRTFCSDDEDDRFDDDQYTPKVFALSCPSLKTYTSTQLCIDWCISRNAEGTVLVERPWMGRHNSSSREWNPPFFQRHWPCILPKGREQDRGDVDSD
ncbi:hypothetical protein Hypma_013409 [Hypsizygus marmoreus]|uniref:F-box domain-containing protein n=1 Tax=Hypsizygus marmoreus TaxID=39966 RepID=A0A369JBU3_HYPMA|nr:hypothetical protein Hypma_013409 [Hypsizygus marmoreus]